MSNPVETIELNITHREGTIEVTGDDDRFILELTHPELVDRQSAIFALWAFLPIAMTKGRNLRIHGGGDSVVKENAEQLARVWAAWMPHKFSPVSVEFTQEYSTPNVGTGKELMLFSGGVDSTYNLLLRHREGKQQTLLTIHGIDYKHADEERFAKLLKKTQPLADLVGSDRIFVRTNAYDIYNRKYGIGVEVGHAFVLASNLFLYSAPFTWGEISADYSRFQEVIVAPWGTNGYTNPLFTSKTFGMNTANLDVTRSQKLRSIAASEVALHTLSLCKKYEFRPDNCGVCTKCLTIKAMFLAELGSIPEIFADQAFTEELFETVPFRRRGDRAFLVDIIETARRNNHLHLIHGIDKKIAQLREEPYDPFAKPPKVKKEVRKRGFFERLLSNN